MEKPYVEANVKGKKILRMDAPFDVALADLRNEGIKNPMSAEELAYARIYHSEGKKSSLMTRGSYTRAGFVYLKGENPIRVTNSPLLNKSLAQKAVQANKDSNYFSTKKEEMYVKARKLAEKDKNKEPEKRGAITLPFRDTFSISSTENSEVFETIFGKVGKEYISFLGFDALKVYLVDKDIIDSQPGTILTQEWLAKLANDSNVLGDGWDLGYADSVRGVFLDAEGGVQKTSRLVLPYTSRDVDRVVKIIDGVKSGTLPASKLEKVLQFTSKLRGKQNG